MQQKLCSRGSGSFLLERTGPACGGVPAPVASCELPFRCPRCGEQRRFGSLASLRLHLETRHAYRPPDAAPGGFSITGSLPDPLAAAAAWRDLPARRGQHGAVRRRTQSVGVGAPEEDEDTGEEEEEGEARQGSEVKQSDAGRLHQLRFPPPSPDRNRDLDPVECAPPAQSSRCGPETAAASAAVRRRLAGLLRAADGSMQRRLAAVSSDLARTDTELLCERAQSEHLAQERQQLAERQRSLSRQVDVAVMVIAALREQLSASEGELERREREVLTIQRFLEAAARQETSGKLRIQRFIESLLGRIALAERLLEFYQGTGGPAPGHSHQPQTDDGRPRITQTRSAGGQLCSGFRDNRTPSSCRFGAGPPGSKAGPDRDRERQERLAQSSRLFCRPEHRDDIWNQQRRRSEA